MRGKELGRRGGGVGLERLKEGEGWACALY